MKSHQSLITIAASLIWGLSAGCSASSVFKPGVYTQPFSVGGGVIKQEPGIVYFWPETVFHWSADFVVVKRQIFVKIPNKPDEPKNDSVPEFSLLLAPGNDSIKVTSSVRADYDFGFFVPANLLTGSRTKVNNLKIALSDNLLLNSVGGEFDDRRADIFSNIINFGLSLAKVAFGVAFAPDLSQDEYVKEEILKDHKFTYRREIPFEDIQESPAKDPNDKTKCFSEYFIKPDDPDFAMFLLSVTEALNSDTKLNANIPKDGLKSELTELTLRFAWTESPGLPEDSHALFIILHEIEDHVYSSNQPNDKSDTYFRGIPYRIPGRVDIQLRLSGVPLTSKSQDVAEAGSYGFIDVSGDKWVDSTFATQFAANTGALKDYTITSSSRDEQISSLLKAEMENIGKVYQAIQTAKETAASELEKEKQNDVNQQLAIIAKENEIQDQLQVIEKSQSEIETLTEELSNLDNSNLDEAAKAAKRTAIEATILDKGQLIDRTEREIQKLEKELYYLSLGYSVASK